MPSVSYSDPAVLAFIVIPALLVVAFAWAVDVAWMDTGGSPSGGRRAALIALGASGAWMALTWTAASSGVLRRWEDTPPPFGLLVAAIVSIAIAITVSPVGRRLATGLPLWALIAVQAFRLPLELAMHAMYERGVMPVQMSYSGRNFDIVTGLTAIIVAGAIVAGSGGRRLAIAWNILGTALLVNVVIVAMLGTPRFRYFGDDQLNVWVTYPPFIWLPAVMVLAALAGHLVIFRALLTRHR